jgi:hypothetical protein
MTERVYMEKGNSTKKIFIFVEKEHYFAANSY